MKLYYRPRLQQRNPGWRALQRGLDLVEERLDFGAVVRAGIGFEPRQQLSVLSKELHKHTSHHRGNVIDVERAAQRAALFLVHQLRVPKLKPTLGPLP